MNPMNEIKHETTAITGYPKDRFISSDTKVANPQDKQNILAQARDFFAKPSGETADSTAVAGASEIKDANDKPAAKKQKFVLLVGINDYINPAINDLSGCENDANGLAQCLGDKWKGAQTTKLLSRQATKQNIMNWFIAVSRIVKPGDEVFIAYSGHGTNDGTDGYICPADTKSNDRTSLISGVELSQWRAMLGSAVVAYAIDSCFSGSIPDDFQGAKAETKRKSYTGIRYAPMSFSKSNFNQDYFYSRVAWGVDVRGDLYSTQPTIMLTASSADQYSQEDPYFKVEGLPYRGYGAFMGWMMNGIGVGAGMGRADADKNGNISFAGETYKWAFEGVTKNYRDQTPQVFYSGAYQGTYYNWAIKAPAEKDEAPSMEPASSQTAPAPSEGGKATGAKQAEDKTKTTAPGKVYVLSVGINRYDQQSYLNQYGLVPSNLSWCVKDAVDLGSSLQSPMCPAENVTVIKDENATWDNVQAQTRAIKQKMGPNDKLIIYVSGHGTNDGTQGYICLHDKMVSGPQLAALRDEVGANDTAFIFDSCQNGALIGKGVDQKVAAGKNTRYFKIDTPKFKSKDDFIWAQEQFTKNLAKPNTFVYTSCRGDEFSQEDPKLKHGLFTYALIQGLQWSKSSGTYMIDNPPFSAHKPDGQISMEELVKFASWRTALISMDTISMRPGSSPEAASVIPQHPQYWDSDKGNEFVIKGK